MSTRANGGAGGGGAAPPLLVPPRPPPPPPRAPAAPTTTVLTVATGADSPFFAAMRNLAGSVRFWCPPDRCRLAVFDLGLSPDELDEARAWCGASVHWSGGGSSGGTSPAGNPGNYAFKALAVEEAVRDYGHVLWLDAGSTVTGRLYESVLPHMLHEGAFLVQGQDLDMVPWVHPGMFRHFGVEDASRFRGLHSYSGNTVGFVAGSAASAAILPPWVACAKNASCIDPPGSSRGNHRYDQAALSVIAHSSGVAITPRTDLLAASRGQLRPCMEASDMVVWTSRRGESCYAGFTHRGCDGGT